MLLMYFGLNFNGVYVDLYVITKSCYLMLVLVNLDVII